MPRASQHPDGRGSAWPIAVVCAGLLTFVGPAAAQEPVEDAAADSTARSYRTAGQQAFEEGRYQEALNYYQRAYELSEAPLLLYNIGQSADRLRLDSTALQAFELYLQHYPEAPNHEEVESRVLALQRAVETRDAAMREKAEEDQTKISVDVTETLMPSPYSEGDRPVPDSPLTKWWFWTAAGGVVLAVVITAIAVSSGDDEVRDPVAGDGGVIVTTLSLP